MRRADEAQVRGYTAGTEQELRRDGGLPLTLRIGVTGHRDIADPAGAQQEVTHALGLVLGALGLPAASRHVPLRIEVFSPLASGADQVVVEAAFSLKVRGTELIAPVPEDEAGYEDSIKDDGAEALERYRCWVRRARKLVAAQRADEAGFRQLGETVVDHCDVLFALWDGQPAAGPGAGTAQPGTAAIVSYALNHPREIPVVVIPVARSRAPAGPPGGLPAHAQLLLRPAPRNPFAELFAWARRQRGGGPEGLTLRLSNQSETLTLDDSGQQRSAAAEKRQEEFQRSVRAWRFDKRGARVLRRSDIGRITAQLRGFNTSRVAARARSAAGTRDPALRLPGIVAQARAADRGAARQDGADAAYGAATEILDWMGERYRRANCLAMWYQKWFRRFDRSVYVFAATAVVCAAMRIIWTRQGSWEYYALTYADVTVLTAALVILASGMRGWIRNRWVSCRVMAEYLRTYAFLALLGARPVTLTADEATDANSLALNEFIGPTWFERTMGTIWQQRPKVPHWSDRDVPWLRRVLNDLVLDQYAYHYRSEGRHSRLHTRIIILVTAFFVVTVLGALAHIFASGLQVEDLLNLVAIGVPGFAAATNSISPPHEHHHHAMRSEAAMHRLSRWYLPQLTEAGTLPELRKAATAVGGYLRSEATEWYEVMAIQSLDVPT